MDVSLLGWNSTASGSPAARTAIILKANSQVIKDLRECARSHKQIRLQTGRIPRLQYGTRTVDLTLTPEKFTHEIYTSTGPTQDLHYAATVTQRAIAVPAPVPAPDVAGTDSALAALKQSLASFAQEKEAKQATISTSVIPSSKSNRILSNRYVAQAPRVTSAASSPLPNHTSAGLGPTSVPAVDRDVAARNKAMTFVLSHYLSSGEKSEAEIQRSTKIAVSRYPEVASKVAERVSDSKKWKLKDKAYKDLDLWKFPFPVSSERDAAVECAVRAFDRLRLSKEDKHWQMLLPERERGKGKCSSRLHGNNSLTAAKDRKSPLGAASTLAPGYSESQVNDGHLTPKPTSSAMTRTSSATGKPLSIEKRLKESQKQRAAEEAKAKKKEKEKSTKNDDSTSLTHPGATMKISASTKKTSPTKFKSAERVHESDDDSGGEMKATATSIDSARKSRPSQAAARSPPGTSSSEGRPLKQTAASQARKSQAAGRLTPSITSQSASSPGLSASEPRKLTPSQRAEKHSAAPVTATSKPANASKVNDVKVKNTSPPNRPAPSTPSMFGTQGRSPAVIKKVVNGSANKGHRPSTSITSLNSSQKRPASASENEPPRKLAKTDSKMTSTKAEQPANSSQTRAADSGLPLKRKANDISSGNHSHDIYKTKHHRTESSSTQSLALSMSSGASHTTTAQTSTASPSPPSRDQWITARSPSATSSTSGDPERRAWQQALDDAEKFRQTLYPAYLKLYNRLNSMGPGEQKREDVEELYRMHDRLSAMKRGIRQAAHA